MVNLSEIRAAAQRIAPYVSPTPLLRAAALDQLLGCRVWLKPEMLQHTGSFKLRGATNALLCLDGEERRRGVVCCSSGNHAQGVACAASRLGVEAVIVMPSDCNPVKKAGAEAFGAKVVLAGLLSSERDAVADRLTREEGRVLIHPYANDRVRAGQGTIGLEILADQPQIDAIVVPLGGGGLLSGVATAARGIRPQLRMIGAEPAGAARYGLSRQLGRPAWLERVKTIADGTRTDHADGDNFAIIEDLVQELTVAEDQEIRAAIFHLARYAKLIAEPSAALGVAAALSGHLRFDREEQVCFVLSGGNNDFALLSDILTHQG